MTSNEKAYNVFDLTKYAILFTLLEFVLNVSMHLNALYYCFDEYFESFVISLASVMAPQPQGPGFHLGLLEFGCL